MTDAVIAIAQFAPGADKGENIAAIEALAATAVERGAGLVVFPEYSSYFTPQLGPDWVEAAEAVDGPFGAALAALAARLRVHLVAGLIERRAGGRISNTLVAVDDAGVLVSTYRKLHLYDAFGQRESDWIVPGEIEDPSLFRWGGLTVGMQTCYDIRFPEVSRRIVDAGADLVLLPAEWARGPLKEHHWRTLVTARAIENTVYLAAADHTPPVGVGASMVVDPMGVELAMLGEGAGVALAWLSRERIDEVRRVNPALRSRRFGVSVRQEPEDAPGR